MNGDDVYVYDDVQILSPTGYSRRQVRILHTWANSDSGKPTSGTHITKTLPISKLLKRSRIYLRAQMCDIF